MTAIADFNLDVAEGEFVCVVGPSGCGKSTFLRILAGLDTISSGEVRIVPGADPSQPLNNVVFQEYAIFPWKTVLDNVAFGLEMRGIGKVERYTVAREWIDRVGLRKFADYYPHQISGGMKQRVSIARALANDPQVLLMDEPLGALDAQTRTVLQEELLRIWEANRKTVVYITHSIDEAVLLGDRVVLMTAHPGANKAIFDVDHPSAPLVGDNQPRRVQRTNLSNLGIAAGRGHAFAAGADGRDRVTRTSVAIIVAIAVWNALLSLTGLWERLWWLGLLVNFALIVMLAEQVGRTVSPQRRRAFELVLAIGFPVLLLVAWELIVRAEILNARWFPPPTRDCRGPLGLDHQL